MKKKLIVLSGLILGSAPLIALAQSRGLASGSACTGITPGGPSSNTTFFMMLCTIGNILNSIVPILIALGVVYFVWGVVSYVIASDEEAKKTGRNRIIYGIIGLAVIIGMWGLVSILGNTFGVNGGIAPTGPAFPITQ